MSKRVASCRTIGMLVVALLLVAGAGERVFAQVGGAAVVFLQIEPDSRSAAMGNTGVALADNANALFWNPAGLAFQSGMELSITHSPWLPEFNAGLFYDYLVAKYNVPGWGTFGAHVTYLNLGEHEARDEQNNPLGTFRSHDVAVGGSYGTKIGSRLGVGTGIRLIYSNLAPGQVVGSQETKAGISVGFDAAAMYRIPGIRLGSIDSEFSIGANLNNMGPTIQYSDGPQADPIPTNFRFGWAYKMKFDEYNSLTIANDFNKLLIDRDSTGVTPWYQAVFSGWKAIDVNTGSQTNPQFESLGVIDQLTIGIGLEYWYNNLFAFRSGFFHEHPYNGDRQFLTLGAGIRYNIIGVDFSYIYPLEENHPLANTMRFSLLVGR